MKKDESKNEFFEKLSELDYSIHELKAFAKLLADPVDSEELNRIANSLEESLNFIENSSWVKG